MNKCWQHANSGIQDFAACHISFICYQIEENKAVEQAVDYWIDLFKGPVCEILKGPTGMKSNKKKYAFI